MPAKVESGYANFAVAEPPLKLVLLENAHPGADGGGAGVCCGGQAAEQAAGMPSAVATSCC